MISITSSALDYVEFQDVRSRDDARTHAILRSINSCRGNRKKNDDNE